MAIGAYLGIGLLRLHRLVSRHQIGSVIPVSYTHLDVYKRQIQLVFSDNGQGNGREARTLCFWENNDRYWSFTGQLCLTNALELSKNY